MKNIIFLAKENENSLWKLSNALIACKWDDAVKHSYDIFARDENTLASQILWDAQTADAIFERVKSVDIEKLKSEYSECAAQLDALQN